MNTAIAPCTVIARRPRTDDDWFPMPLIPAGHEPNEIEAAIWWSSGSKEVILSS